MEFTIEVQGAEAIQGKLRRLQSSLLDWSVAMFAIGTAYKAYFSSIPFASRGGVYGRVWPDLNPSYKSWKAKKFPGKPMLVRTGAMQQGFNFMATRNLVKIGNTVPYFEKHQKGVGTPQRIVMALTKERRKAATDILEQELKRKMRAV